MNIPTLKEILGVFAVALGLLGYVFYIRGILQNRVKPHAFTWLIWGFLTGIAFFAQLNKGGGAGAWVTGVTAFLVFVLQWLGFVLLPGNLSLKVIGYFSFVRYSRFLYGILQGIHCGRL